MAFDNLGGVRFLRVFTSTVMFALIHCIAGLAYLDREKLSLGGAALLGLIDVCLGDFSLLKNSVTVVVTGGLGNQLFILSAGIQQAMKLGADLVLDVRQYDSNNIRAFELGKLALDELPIRVSIINENLSTMSKFSMRVLSALRKFFPSKRVFTEKVAQVYNSEPELKANSTLFGYFQSAVFASEGSKHVVKLLAKFSQEHSLPGVYISSLSSDEASIALQVRQGDYLEPSVAKLYGTTSIAYFKRAVNLIASVRPVGKIRIFSDAPENMGTLAAEFSNVEIVSPNPSASPLENLIELSLADCHVISNSTFGWWAAFLADYVLADPDRVVVAPRPWTLDSRIGVARDLLPVNWITFDNRESLWGEK